VSLFDNENIKIVPIKAIMNTSDIEKDLKVQAPFVRLNYFRQSQCSVSC
jgi:hypothetical protein